MFVTWLGIISIYAYSSFSLAEPGLHKLVQKFRYHLPGLNIFQPISANIDLIRSANTRYIVDTRIVTNC